MLWFAWKFVPLWYQQQRVGISNRRNICCDLLENSYLCGISNNRNILSYNCLFVVICLKIRTFVVSATTCRSDSLEEFSLWFAWKFVPLWYQQQHQDSSYNFKPVVICLKIRTFVVSATTSDVYSRFVEKLWFAWKFVPLWYQQQQNQSNIEVTYSCDLLENSYLCGISNNFKKNIDNFQGVVICLKIRTFVVSATTRLSVATIWWRCDLLENSYLCGISNN